MTSPGLRKHVEARDIFGSDFSTVLDTGVDLTGTPTIRITRGHTDVSSEFLATPPDAAIDGTAVTFTLVERADATKQLPGVYIVCVACATTATPAAVVVDTWTLVSHDEGTAPAPAP